MKTRFLYIAAAVVLTASSLFAQNGDLSGRGNALITVLPNNAGEHNLNVSRQDVRQVKVDGKTAQVTGWRPLQRSNSPVQLIFLIDSDARSSLGTQFSSLKEFVNEMPPDTKMAIAYMANGTAELSQPLSSNPSEVLKALRLPEGIAGETASPYFCLSDLAKHWPSHDLTARRIVVMISDGIDYYDLHYDLQDPYVRAAIDDSVRNHLVVYTLYWGNVGRISHFGFEQQNGQDLMLEVTQATGGYGYWEGLGNPVDYTPYLQNLRRRLDNQFLLDFAAPIHANGGKVEDFSFSLTVPNAKVDAPGQVYVYPAKSSQ